MKKNFGCGHKGKGAFCHRCDTAVKILDESKKEKDTTRAALLKGRAEALFVVPKRASSAALPSTPVPV
jgi:hypothetical protein